MFSLLRLWEQSMWLRRGLVLLFSGVTILGVAGSCSLVGGGGNSTVYGILKRHPSLQEKQEDANPDGFAKINTVKPPQAESDNPNFIQDGLTDLSIVKLVRVNKDILYALSQESGLFKTTDGGLVWERVYIHPVDPTSENFDSQLARNNQLNITDIDYSPDVPQNIYVSVVEDKFAKIYASRDGGQNFEQVYKEIQSGTSIRMLTIDPQNPSNIYAMLSEGALLVSRDGDRTWKKLRSFEQNPIQMGFIPEFENMFYILFRKAGLATSTDEGRTWQIKELTKADSEIGEKQPKDELDVSFEEDPTFGIYEKIVPVTAGINYNSETGQITNANGKQPWLLIADRQMWFSTDAGEDFQKLVLPSQAEQYNISDIAPDPVNGLNKIYVSIDNKLFLTQNQGETWSTKDFIKVNGGNIGNISQILIEPTNTSIKYLSLVDKSADSRRGLFVF